MLNRSLAIANYLMLSDAVVMKNYFLASIFSLFCLNAFAEDVKVHSYTVKGVIKQLPSAGDQKAQLLIKHEEIPAYVGEDGEVVGMHAMTMPFFASENLDLSVFKVGDCINFNFDSWWGSKPGDKVTSMTKIDCES